MTEEIKTPEFINFSKDTREFKIQVAIIDHFRGYQRHGNKVTQGSRPFHNLLAVGVHQGRNKEEGFFLKMLGVMAGMTDIQLFWRDGFGFIEVKTEDGRLSPPQEKFRSSCLHMGWNWSVARSVREAHDLAKKWTGYSPIHEAIIEPDLRNIAQKKTDAFNFYKPS